MTFSAPLLLCLLLAAPSPAGEAAVQYGPKPFGVLLLGEAGGEGWEKTVAEVRKNLGTGIPVEAAAGEPNVTDLRRAFDKLKAARVEKVVVVPVYLRTDDEALELARYLMGMTRYPPESFVKGSRSHVGQAVVKRAVTKADKFPPISMSAALDSDPVLADALFVRAKELSREPELESLVIAARGSADRARAEAQRTVLRRLAKKVKSLGKFKTVSAALVTDAAAKPRDQMPDFTKQEKAPPGPPPPPGGELRETVRELSRSGRVLVVPFLLEPDGTERAFKKSLESFFVQWNGKGLLPHPGVVNWIKARAAEGRKAPDMAKERDEGRAPQPPERKKVVR